MIRFGINLKRSSLLWALLDVCTSWIPQGGADGTGRRFAELPIPRRHKPVSVSSALMRHSPKASDMPADLPPDPTVGTMPRRRLVAFAGGFIGTAIVLYLLAELIPRIMAA